jgi:hypothetical protein
MYQFARVLTLALLILSLGGCLFRTAQPVITPDMASTVPVETGYLYSVDAKNGSVTALKFERQAAASNLYLFYDEDERRPPAATLFADLGDGNFLVQQQGPASKTAKPRDFPYEYSLLKIEQGCAYVVDESSERFYTFIEEKKAATFLHKESDFFPPLAVPDRAKFLEALGQFARTANYDRGNGLCDAPATKRRFPDKKLPK